MKNIIDTNKDPLIPYKGWTVESHEKSGDFEITKDSMKLHFEPEQKESYIQGNLLAERMKGKGLNANVLDYLLDNPHLIPEDWKVDEKGQTRYIFFWGTVYRDSDGSLYVRCLCFDGGHWQQDDDWLDSSFDGLGPSVVSASPLNIETQNSLTLCPLPLELTINGVIYVKK